jgi:ABC-type molybdate transport system substrate-binding protein
MSKEMPAKHHLPVSIIRPRIAFGWGIVLKNSIRMQGWILGLVLMLSSATLAWAEAPVIAGAADLKFALEEVAAAFKKDTGREVNLVLGSSGNLYRQIGQGAPFRMFLSADEGFVFKLAADHLMPPDDGPRDPAGNS